MSSTTASIFRYEALDLTGTVVKGAIESSSAEAAATSLTGQRLVPLSVTPPGRD